MNKFIKATLITILSLNILCCSYQDKKTANKELNQSSKVNESKPEITSMQTLIDNLKEDKLSFEIFLVLKRRFCLDNPPNDVFIKEKPYNVAPTNDLLKMLRYGHHFLPNIIKNERLINHFKQRHHEDLSYFFANTRMTEYKPKNIMQYTDYTCETLSSNNNNNKKSYQNFINDKTNYDLNNSYKHDSSGLKGFELLSFHFKKRYEKAEWQNNYDTDNRQLTVEQIDEKVSGIVE